MRRVYNYKMYGLIVAYFFLIVHTKERRRRTRFTFFLIAHSRLCRIAFNIPRLSRNKNLQRLIAYTVIIRFLCQRRNCGVTKNQIYQFIFKYLINDVTYICHNVEVLSSYLIQYVYCIIHLFRNEIYTKVYLW